MAGLTRKEIKHDEFLETATEAGHWLEENWRLVAMILGAALVLLVAVLGWRQWSQARSADLQERLGEALAQYAAIDPSADDVDGQLTAAIDSFRALADDAGARSEGVVARFYTGRILLRQGHASEAVAPLQRAVEEAVEPTVRQNARIALGRALADSGDVEAAEPVLRAVADDADSTFPPEEGLMTLAALWDEAGEPDRAREALREVVERFPESDAARRAREQLDQ